jgi:acyl-CoA thioester hydrolase
MAKSFTKSFVIREADCDPYGHLATASYLRLLYEADREWNISLPGKELDRQLYTQQWRPGTAYIEFLLPLQSSDQLELSLFPGIQEGNRSQRAYTFRIFGENHTAARALITWRRNEQQLENPLQDQNTAMGFEPSAYSEVLQNFHPEHPPPMTVQPAGTFEIQRQVEWSDVDRDYKLHFSAFIKYIIDCSIRVGEAFGWSIQTAQEDGTGYVARKLWINHHQYPTLGSEVNIATWVSLVKRSTIIRHYVLGYLASHQPIATAHILWVSVDIDTGRPTRHPQRWMDGFERQISNEIAI